MSISISEMYISRQDDRYEIDVNNTKNKMQRAKKHHLRAVHWIYRYNPTLYSAETHKVLPLRTAREQGRL